MTTFHGHRPTWHYRWIIIPWRENVWYPLRRWWYGMGPRPKSVAEFIAQARESGHDSLGVANDPEFPRFKIGEVINPDEWDLQLIITSLWPLKARVTKTHREIEEWFPLDRELTFGPRLILIGGQESWNIHEPDGLPWFSLWIQDGKKRFTHYR